MKICSRIFFYYFFNFAPNIECVYKLEKNRLAEAVLTSTHNLCFGAKIRKIGILLHTVLLYISGVQRGTLHGYVSFRDDTFIHKQLKILSKRKHKMSLRLPSKDVAIS